MTITYRLWHQDIGTLNKPRARAFVENAQTIITQAHTKYDIAIPSTCNTIECLPYNPDDGSLVLMYVGISRMAKPRAEEYATYWANRITSFGIKNLAVVTHNNGHNIYFEHVPAAGPMPDIGAACGILMSETAAHASELL